MKWTDRMHLLAQLRWLAQRCDGAEARDGKGFNAYDTVFGHQLAGLDDLTQDQTEATQQLLRKYRRQLEAMDMAEFDNEEMDLDQYDESGSGSLVAPVGTHLCRLECAALATIGSTMGFKIKGTVVEQNYRGYVAEDVLWFTEKSKGRIKLALHRVAGIESGKINARSIREALDGKLARLTVEKTYFQKKGDNTTEYTEAQAADLKANGETMYAKNKLAFGGYESATAEEVQAYGEKAKTAQNSRVNGLAGGATEKLPF